jgi:hypothetical protein
MEIKKPEYPKMLLAYINGKPTVILEEEQEVHTKEEAETWIYHQQRLGRFVVERKFTKDERKLLPFPRKVLGRNS